MCPPKYAAGLNLQTPERDLPLRQPEMLSLRTFCDGKTWEDPRSSNRSFPFASMITFISMALLAGRSSLAAIHRYGQFLTDAHRRALDWPPKKNAPGRKAPSYTAIRNLLRQLDPDAFAVCISAWLNAHHGELPRALALDGKWVRDRLLSVALSEHETGAPVQSALPQLKSKTIRTSAKVSRLSLANSISTVPRWRVPSLLPMPSTTAHPMQKPSLKPTAITSYKSNKRIVTVTKLPSKSLQRPLFYPHRRT